MMSSMKGACLYLLLTGLLLSLVFCAPSALAESGDEAEEAAEWTVMFYLCGSDLESKYGYGTGNLEEIASVCYPDNYLSIMAEMYGVDIGIPAAPGTVNILIETGGAKEWHTQDPEKNLGMDIDPGALQRWRYNYYPIASRLVDDYELMQTLPLESMAEPQTLADFIRWGAETCPAKKYALVLGIMAAEPRRACSSTSCSTRT